MSVFIRKAKIEDVSSIVKIHDTAFPEFFLTSLGDDFLRLYYSCMCKSKEALTLCAFENGEMLGFSSTALKSAGFNIRLIKNNVFKFMGETIKLMLTKPGALLRLAKNITKKAEGVDDDGDYAELYSIAVSPTCQGKGIGGLLLTENERIIHEWGGVKLSLTTDYDNNQSAIAFYQRNGYQILYKFKAYPNREMYRFIKDLE